MISNETLKTIKERPEFQELLKYLADETKLLNSLSEIDDTVYGPQLVTEVVARKRAYQTLKKILEPLIDLPELMPRSKLDDYDA